MLVELCSLKKRLCGGKTATQLNRWDFQDETLHVHLAKLQSEVFSVGFGAE